MPRLTGGQAVVASLRAHGVDTVFGIPGVHTLPLYDALLETPEIRHVLARHEQGVGFMADGYARVSGKVGVASAIADFCHARLIHAPLQRARLDSRQ